MKLILVFSSFIFATFAQYPPSIRSQYGPPTVSRQPLYNNGPSLQPSSALGEKIYRQVTVFVAPPEPPQIIPPKSVAPAIKPDKHYQIIFVKAPSQSTRQATEIQLPSEPERKTVVYVLVKNPEQNQNQVKIRPVPPTRPSKPEVFFINYKDNLGPNQNPLLTKGSGLNNLGLGNSALLAAGEPIIQNSVAITPSGSYGPPPPKHNRNPITSTSYGPPLQNRENPSGSYGAPRL